MKSTIFERLYGNQLIGNQFRRNNTDIAYQCFVRLCKELKLNSSTLYTGYAIQPDFKNKTIDVIIYKVDENNKFSVDVLYNIKGEYYCIFSVDVNLKISIKENKTNINIEKKLKNDYFTFQSLLVSLIHPINYKRLFNWYKKYDTEKIIRLYAGSNIIKFIFKDFICVGNNNQLTEELQRKYITVIENHVYQNCENYEIDVDDNGVLIYKNDEIEFKIGMVSIEKFYLIYNNIMFEFNKIDKQS